MVASDCPTVDCPFREDTPEWREKVRQLEKREDLQDEEIKDLRELATGVNGKLERMEGKLEGALIASKLSGAVIGSLVALTGSGLVGLLLYLLQHKGGSP